jgi:hypothetical protein
VKQTKFKKLTQHLRTKHGFTAVQARGAASFKKVGANKKTKSGRNYFMCKECKILVAKKGQHLRTSLHGLQMDTGPYQEALRSMFISARMAMPQYVHTTEVGDVGGAVLDNHDVPDINFSDPDDNVNEAAMFEQRTPAMFEPSAPGPAPVPGQRFTNIA